MVSKWQLIQSCYLGLGSSVPQWDPPLSLGRLKILPLSSKKPCYCEWITYLTSLSSSCNWVLGVLLQWTWQGVNESSWYSGGRFTVCGLSLQWSWPLMLSKLVIQTHIYRSSISEHKTVTLLIFWLIFFYNRTLYLNSGVHNAVIYMYIRCLSSRDSLWTPIMFKTARGHFRTTHVIKKWTWKM